MDRKIKGLTVVELVVAVVILAIILAIAIPPFMGWLRKYNIEKDMKTIQATLQEARMRAFSEKIDLTVTVSGNQICYKCSTDDSNCISKYGTDCLKTVDLSYNYPSVNIEISKRGVFSTANTIGYTSENSASYDCVKISNLRAVLEKCNGHF
ncbi:prepilin-type N-terminal cleavage/methylation domain-containing protein [Persephonella sp.]